ncbi:unnamed protein product [Polarella glacialis]|uniref:Uncharacterized protein n=1 Tax=Polarella glacialis TaxID=89957 RepID=A0A813IAR4_POLGL|nr:unnamed protein product [Polarella glacialis]
MLATARFASSSCSGVLTAEMARAVLQKVVNESGLVSFRMNIKSVQCWELNQHCHHIMAESHDWCNRVTGETLASHPMPRVFGDLLEQVPGGSYNPADRFHEKARAISLAWLNQSQECKVHDGFCWIQPVDLDISGLPCTDNSRSGLKKYEEGPAGPIFAVYAKRHIANKTPLLIIENTRELRLDVITLLLGDHFFLWQLWVDAEDGGHNGVSRKRTFVICSHQDRTSCMYDPFELYAAIAARVKKHIATKPSDYVTATDDEILREASHVALVRGVQFRPHELDLTYLLNKRELTCIDDFKSKYAELYPGTSAEDDPDLVCFLGDSTGNRYTWSGTSGKISTFRLNAKTGKYFLPHCKRWLTAGDRLGAMGFPVSQNVAEAMGVPQIPILDAARAGDLAGNAMHFNNAAIVQLVAMSCFRLLY